MAEKTCKTIETPIMESTVSRYHELEVCNKNSIKETISIAADEGDNKVTKINKTNKAMKTGKSAKKWKVWKKT